jgi:hypothetical protein
MNTLISKKRRPLEQVPSNQFVSQNQQQYVPQQQMQSPQQQMQSHQQQMQSPQQQQQQMPPGERLSLPQVIHIINTRLLKLESFANESSNTVSREVNEDPKYDELFDEFDKRYNLLADEINKLKDIVLSLQSFTMEVNKALIEDRNRFFTENEEEEPTKQT